MSQKSSIARAVVPLIVGLIALGIVAAVIQGRGNKQKQSAEQAPTPTETTAAPEAAPGPAPGPAPATTPAAAPSLTAANALVARAPTGVPAAYTPLGSLDPAAARMRVEFAPKSAGIAQIVFSEYWNTAAESRAAAAHSKDASAALPPDDARHTLRPEGHLPAPSGAADPTPRAVPLLAVHSVDINGASVDLFGAVWSERAPGTFVTEVVEQGAHGDTPIARIVRSFTFAGDGFDLLVSHTVECLSAQPINVRLWLYGPGDLTLEQGGLLDVRRFQLGYLLPESRDPSQSTVVSHDGQFDRSVLIGMVEESGSAILWPAENRPGESLSWLGSTNRYFSLAVHAPLNEASGATSKSLARVIDTVYLQQGTGAAPAVFSLLSTVEQSVPAGGSAMVEFSAYAGPLSRTILLTQQPFEALGMVGLIVYQMSGCCSFCTFAWLANGLVIFLEVLHDHVFFDWALAIIALVIVVRLALHPLTRKSQIQMQKMGRLMSALKPQLEDLQKRFKDEPKRLQQEQMRLYSEYGVNPLGCLGGIVPMFLQMPIWIALYAVLYLAFELRQQAAFFGLFQKLDGWVFLGDLSSPDRFISFGRSFDFYFFSIDSFNIVPILMGIVFFIQQKYMAPPTMGTMTPEQEQQQKMMKWMTVILFPVMLYKAPSGLTLYIMTSTLIGIWESMRIRKEVAVMDLSPKKRDEVKPKDALGRRYAEALERLKSRGEKKRDFKDRS